MNREWLLDGVIEDMPAEHQVLINETLQMLAEAELTDVIDVLEARVVGPFDDGPAGDLRERQLIDRGGRLQPTVVELLKGLQWVTKAPGWTDRMRLVHALQQIGQAGF